MKDFKHGKSGDNKLQIKTVKDVILKKERLGEDATFERDLLKAWSKVEGFENAKLALKECDEGK